MCIIIINTCYICNIGRRDVPDMYAQVQECAALKGKCGRIKQIPIAHVTYVM